MERAQDRGLYHHDGGADGGGQLEPWVNASRAVPSNSAPSWSGSCPATATAPPRVSRAALRRLGGDAARHRVGHRDAVNRGADAAEDRDAERPAELGAGLRDRRCRAGPLGRGAPDDQVGRQGERPERAPESRSTDPMTRTASPEAPATWVSTPKPTAARTSRPPITYAGRTRRTIAGASMEPTMKRGHRGHRPQARLQAATARAPAADTAR